MQKHLPYALQETPFEYLFGLFCMVVGPFSMFTGTPRSIDAFLPVWAHILWGVSLTISGVLITLGRSIRRNGELIEQAGLAMLCSATVLHALSILSLLNVRGVTTGAMYLCVGLACAVRFHVLTKYHRDVVRGRNEDNL